MLVIVDPLTPAQSSSQSPPEQYHSLHLYRLPFPAQHVHDQMQSGGLAPQGELVGE